MDLERFGMDIISLAGSLEGKLAAIRAAGFGQVMLSAREIVAHPQGADVAIAAVRASGLRVTGLLELNDFEGLSGHLHEYKIDIAKAMLTMCRAVESKVLLACSSTSSHATDDRAHLIRDLQKLSMLAAPLGIRIAYQALSWGRHVNEYPQAWDIVDEADRGNLGLGLNSFHLLATQSGLDVLEDIDPGKIFQVQLADFMWTEVRSTEERQNTERHFCVFPGEGVHGDELVAFVRRLEQIGYAGDYSLEVFNDDYHRIAPKIVAERARTSVRWLGDQVARGNLMPWTRPER